MAEPLPERSYPLPSPQPSREMLEASWGLDLTPERDVKPRERLRKLKAPSSRRLKAHDGGFTDEGTTCITISLHCNLILRVWFLAPALSIPQLNSTSVLCSQIQQLKLQPRDPTQHLHYSDPETEKKLPTVVKDNIAVLSDLEGVLNQRPVTVSGVIVITSDLNDIFCRRWTYPGILLATLTWSQWKSVIMRVWLHNLAGRKQRCPSSHPLKRVDHHWWNCILYIYRMTIAYNVHVYSVCCLATLASFLGQFYWANNCVSMLNLDCKIIVNSFSSELEWEEAAWNVDTNCYASCVESLDAPNNFPSSFYSYMYQSWCFHFLRRYLLYQSLILHPLNCLMLSNTSQQQLDLIQAHCTHWLARLSAQLASSIGIDEWLRETGPKAAVWCQIGCLSAEDSLPSRSWQNLHLCQVCRLSNRGRSEQAQVCNTGAQVCLSRWRASQECEGGRTPPRCAVRPDGEEKGLCSHGPIYRANRASVCSTATHCILAWC